MFDQRGQTVGGQQHNINMSDVSIRQSRSTRELRQEFLKWWDTIDPSNNPKEAAWLAWQAQEKGWFSD